MCRLYNIVLDCTDALYFVQNFNPIVFTVHYLFFLAETKFAKVWRSSSEFCQEEILSCTRVFKGWVDDDSHGNPFWQNWLCTVSLAKKFFPSYMNLVHFSNSLLKSSTSFKLTLPPSSRQVNRFTMATQRVCSSNIPVPVPACENLYKSPKSDLSNVVIKQDTGQRVSSSRSQMENCMRIFSTMLKER